MLYVSMLFDKHWYENIVGFLIGYNTDFWIFVMCVRFVCVFDLFVPTYWPPLFPQIN